MSLPKIKPTQRKEKPKPIYQKKKTEKPKKMNKKIRKKPNSLKTIAYNQSEERDEGMCVVCGRMAQEHHHIIKVGTGYASEVIQRVENVACVCTDCHTMGPESIHFWKGKSAKQIYLEVWQQKLYPEYVAMMRELAKVTGCRDEWLIERWKTKYNNSTTTQQEVAR